MTTIHPFLLANSKSYVDGAFPRKYEVPGSIWNEYVFRTIELTPPQDYVDCGAYCLTNTDPCLIFVMVGNTCYLGRYDYSADPNHVDNANNGMVYEKDCKEKQMVVNLKHNNHFSFFQLSNPTASLQFQVPFLQSSHFQQHPASQK